MASYQFQKLIDSDQLTKELINNGLVPKAINTAGLNVEIVFENSLSESEQLILNSIVTSHSNNPQLEAIKRVVSSAMAFGQSLMVQMAAENIVLGITQDGQSTEVLLKTQTIISALGTGSLYVAIEKAKALPVDQYDGKYITGPRLLSFVNKLEDYLGITRSSAWF